jgi:hypothetical protein
MVEWEDGYFLGQEDSACLREAAAQGLTLVTHDRRTIPPLLKTWAEEGRTHGGVVFGTAFFAKILNCPLAAMIFRLIAGGTVSGLSFGLLLARTNVTPT